MQKYTTSYHEIESSHEQDEVGQKNPMSPQSDFSFFDKGRSNARAVCANLLAFDERLSLWKHQAKNDDENRRASAEPKKLTLSDL